MPKSGSIVSWRRCIRWCVSVKQFHLSLSSLSERSFELWQSRLNAVWLTLSASLSASLSACNLQLWFFALPSLVNINFFFKLLIHLVHNVCTSRSRVYLQSYLQKSSNLQAVLHRTVCSSCCRPYIFSEDSSPYDVHFPEQSLRSTS